jgi:hypothetical protein
MGETVGGNGAAIGRLRQQIQGLVDADLILPEDGLWLMTTLDRSARRLTAGNLAASRSNVQRVIDRLHDLIQTDLLEAADGDRPVEMAREVLAALRGEGLPPAGRVRPAAGRRDRTTGIRSEQRVGIPVVPLPARPEPHAPQEE